MTPVASSLNYQHILELLHQQHNTIDSLQGLLRWLKQEQKKSNDSYTLRRETDSDVVRVETIHSSKRSSVLAPANRFETAAIIPLFS